MAVPIENEKISFRSPDLRATVFVGLLGLGMILYGLWNDSPPFWHFPILIGVIFFFFSVTTYLEPGRGTFRLNKEGIQQVSWFKKSRHLGWQEVDQVKWFPHTCCLQGKGTSISISWTMISRWSVAAPAKAFVERALSPHFDLSIKPVRQWSFDPNVRSFLRWLSKVIGISIAGATLFIVPFAILIFLNASRWIGAVWFGLVLLGIIGLVGRGAREFSRKEEQINPTWRLRRTEGGLDSH
jgi:hypothetical protein